MDDMTKTNETTIEFTPQDLAALGDGKVAYLKSIKSDEIGAIFPGAPAMASGLNLFMLLSADGSPILITDSKDAAIANAWEHDLETVSLH